jgi:hypothetical protein
MAGLLSHSLFAMAVCAVLGYTFGLPGISWGIFLAGFLAMVIELDLDDLSPNTRSPYGHSFFFGIIWVVVFSFLAWGIAFAGSIPHKTALSLTLAIISAYATHIAIDTFTKEGVYSFPKDSNIKKWLFRLSEGDRICWEHWHIFQNRKFEKYLRANDDPILNAIISIPSLLVIIFFVAILPLN